MSKNPAVVGPFASQCDLSMFVLENQCLGRTPAVPATPYILFILVTDPEGDAMMVRAAGITKAAQIRFEQQGIPLLEPSPSMETMLSTYFDLSWEQIQERMEMLRRENDRMPLPGTIQ
jgi:hypothetical protein